MQAAVIVAPFRAHCRKRTAASRISGRASAASNGPGILNPIAGTTTQSGAFEPIACTGTVRPCEVLTDLVTATIFTSNRSPETGHLSEFIGRLKSIENGG